MWFFPIKNLTIFKQNEQKTWHNIDTQIIYGKRRFTTTTKKIKKEKGKPKKLEENTNGRKSNKNRDYVKMQHTTF